jgi:transcriptional regulator with XRE-family HTH domain
MKTVGEIIREKRESLGLLQRHVAFYLDIDQAILSKIERNERRPSKENILKIAEILKLDKEELLVQFISEKFAYEIANEECVYEVLKATEKKVEYLKANLVKL